MSLSKSEYEVLALLWTQNQGLTASEINSTCENRSWKDTSIHLILANMIDKGAIVVDGVVRSGRTYSRIFKAAITPEEYSMMQIKQNASFADDSRSSMTKLFAHLLDSDEVNLETISKIEALLKKKKEEL
jgi:predicted transcriptional regulator